MSRVVYAGKAPPILAVAFAAAVLIAVVFVAAPSSTGSPVNGAAVHEPVTVLDPEDDVPPEAVGESGGLSFQQRFVDLVAYQRCVTERPDIRMLPPADANVTEPGALMTCEALRSTDREALAAADGIVIDWTKCKHILRRLGHVDSDAAAAATTSHALTLRANSSDHKVFLQAFCGVSFQFLSGLAAYVPLQRAATVLDAGANIGFASLLFGLFIRQHGTVVAVDASASTLEVLRANVELMSDVVTPVLGAIVPEAQAGAGETVSFGGDQDEFWGGMVLEEGAAAAEMSTVAAVSLSALAADVPGGMFDFIKLDIEGAEAAVLRDPASRAVLCRATCIFMELHERLVPGCQAAFDDFMAVGCGEGDGFEYALTTGEYIGVCARSAMVSGTRLDA